MNFKRLCIMLTIVFVFLVSAIAGYFTLKYNSELKNNSSFLDKKGVENTTLQTVSLQRDAVINEKTKIIKRYKYSKGETTTKEVIEKATPDILGLDRLGAEKYFKSKEYLMTEFNEVNVILVKYIDIWPIGYYVVKGDSGVINVYHVDEKGELKFVEKADMQLDDLPPQDRKEIEKGKSFPNMDLVTEMIEEYKS